MLPVYFLKASSKKTITVPGYTRKDGTFVPPHQKTVLYDPTKETHHIVSGAGSHSQKLAHKKLHAEIPGFHALPHEEQEAHILSAGMDIQSKASQLAAVSGWKKSALAGANPKPAQWDGFLAQPKAKQDALIASVTAAVGSTGHLAFPGGDQPAPVEAKVSAKGASEKKSVAGGVDAGPQDGDTKQGAEGMLVLKDGHWQAVGGDQPAAAEPAAAEQPAESSAADPQSGDAAAKVAELVSGTGTHYAVKAAKKLAGDPAFAALDALGQLRQIVTLGKELQAVATASAAVSGYKKSLESGKVPTPAQMAAVLAMPEEKQQKLLAELLDKHGFATLSTLHNKALEAHKAKQAAAPKPAKTPKVAKPAAAAKPEAKPEAAPAEKAEAPDTSESWAYDPNTQKGSNAGGNYTDSAGQKWYVKVPKTGLHARNEILAAKLYAAAGVAAPELKLVQSGGKTAVASKWVEGVSKVGPAIGAVAGAKEGFAVDAWLANHDAVGMGYDNLLQGPDGSAVRIDVGGALLYRAQGALKSGFGDEVGELSSLLDHNINGYSATAFAGITPEQLAAGAAKVAAVSPETIHALVMRYGPGEETDREKLAKRLIARRADVLAKHPPTKAAEPKAVDDGPKEGDTKEGADGMLVLKDGHWQKVGEEVFSPADMPQSLYGWKQAMLSGQAPTEQQHEAYMKAPIAAADAALDEVYAKLGPAKAKDLIAISSAGSLKAPAAKKGASPAAIKAAASVVKLADIDLTQVLAWLDHVPNGPEMGAGMTAFLDDLPESVKTKFFKYGGWASTYPAGSAKQVVYRAAALAALFGHPDHVLMKDGEWTPIGVLSVVSDAPNVETVPGIIKSQAIAFKIGDKASVAHTPDGILIDLGGSQYLIGPSTDFDAVHVASGTKVDASTPGWSVLAALANTAKAPDQDLPDPGLANKAEGEPEEFVAALKKFIADKGLSRDQAKAVVAKEATKWLELNEEHGYDLNDLLTDDGYAPVFDETPAAKPAPDPDTPFSPHDNAEDAVSLAVQQATAEGWTDSEWTDSVYDGVGEFLWKNPDKLAEVNAALTKQGIAPWPWSPPPVPAKLSVAEVEAMAFAAGFAYDKASPGKTGDAYEAMLAAAQAAGMSAGEAHAKWVEGKNAAVEAGKQPGPYAPDTFAHTQTGATVHVVGIPVKLSSEAYKAAAAKAKAHGGYYSSFKKGGAKAGFLFPTQAQAQAFANDMNGAAAQDGPKEGDTKQGAEGMLVLKDGRWQKVGEDQLGADPVAAAEPVHPIDKAAAAYTFEGVGAAQVGTVKNGLELIVANLKAGKPSGASIKFMKASGKYIVTMPSTNGAGKKFVGHGPAIAALYQHVKTLQVTAKTGKIPKFTAPAPSAPTPAQAPAPSSPAPAQEAAPKKPKPDPTKLVVDAAKLTPMHDFMNWKGPGDGLSSKPHVNAANAKAEQDLLDFAMKGNLVALKDYHFEAFDKESGESLGLKPISEHPSSHVQMYHSDLVSFLEIIANPPEPAKQFTEAALEAIPAHAYGVTTQSVPASERLGQWISIGKLAGHEKYVPNSTVHVTSSAKTAAKALFHSLASLTKHFISSVQSSGSYNDLFRNGAKKDSYGYSTAAVALSTYKDAATKPEGTVLYRWQHMPDTMVQQLLATPAGTVFQNAGSMCTSMHPTATKHFGNHRLKITYANGAKAVDSFPSGGFSSEQEITTLMGQRFVILNVENSSDIGGTGKAGLDISVLMLPPDQSYISDLVDQAEKTPYLKKAIHYFYKAA